MNDINRGKAMALLESLNDSMDRAIRNALSWQSWPAHSSSAADCPAALHSASPRNKWCTIRDIDHALNRNASNAPCPINHCTQLHQAARRTPIGLMPSRLRFEPPSHRRFPSSPASSSSVSPAASIASRSGYRGGRPRSWPALSSRALLSSS